MRRALPSAVETGAAAAGYPPQPWHLAGQLYLSLWAVPTGRLGGRLPPGARPVGFGRFALIGIAWVRYQAGGVLQYNELVEAVLVRQGWRARLTVTSIWVDDVAARDGGRALWAIPKELADFDFTPATTGDAAATPAATGRATTNRATTGHAAAGHAARGFSAAAKVAGQPVAQAQFRPVSGRLGSLGRLGSWPLRFVLSQPLDGRAVQTPVRARSRLRLASARWQFDGSGPLARLHGVGRPLVSLRLADFRCEFGH